MSLFDKLHGGPEGSDGAPQNLTARQFLGLDGAQGYTKPTEFLAYLKSLRKEEVKDQEQLFAFMQKDLRMENHTKERTDRGNRKYVHPSFYLSRKSAPGVKVILEAGMDKFLSDYAEDLIVVTFSLAELVEEALNAN